MCDPASLKMESSVLTQCLDFSRQMESNQKPFKLEVKLSNGFSFNFNTLDQETSKFRTKEAKKKSPSTIRRNAARKQEFLDKKKISSVDNELSEISLKCDQCDFKVNCKVKLRKHIEKEHKVIPQLDGVNDNNHSEERSSQTDIVKLKQAEVQTESCEIPVTVKWGESDQLALPPGTVVLRYKSKSIYRRSGLSCDVPSSSLGLPSKMGAWPT